MENSSSLVTRLTFLLGITLTAIWLISIATTAFFSYEDIRQRLVNELTHMASLRADLSNYQFEGAERDAISLINRQTRHQMNWGFPIPLKGENIDNTLVNSIICNTPQFKHDLKVTQVYGTSGQTYYLDSLRLKEIRGLQYLNRKTYPTIICSNGAKSSFYSLYFPLMIIFFGVHPRTQKKVAGMFPLPPVIRRVR